MAPFTPNDRSPITDPSLIPHPLHPSARTPPSPLVLPPFSSSSSPSPPPPPPPHSHSTLYTTNHNVPTTSPSSTTVRNTPATTKTTTPAVQSNPSTPTHPAMTTHNNPSRIFPTSATTVTTNTTNTTTNTTATDCTSRLRPEHPSSASPLTPQNNMPIPPKPPRKHLERARRRPASISKPPHRLEDADPVLFSERVNTTMADTDSHHNNVLKIPNNSPHPRIVFSTTDYPPGLSDPSMPMPMPMSIPPPPSSIHDSLLNTFPDFPFDLDCLSGQDWLATEDHGLPHPAPFQAPSPSTAVPNLPIVDPAFPNTAYPQLLQRYSLLQQHERQLPQHDQPHAIPSSVMGSCPPSSTHPTSHWMAQLSTGLHFPEGSDLFTPHSSSGTAPAVLPSTDNMTFSEGQEEVVARSQRPNLGPLPVSLSSPFEHSNQPPPTKIPRNTSSNLSSLRRHRSSREPKKTSSPQANSPFAFTITGGFQDASNSHETPSDTESFKSRTDRRPVEIDVTCTQPGCLNVCCMRKTSRLNPFKTNNHHIVYRRSNIREGDVSDIGSPYCLATVATLTAGDSDEDDEEIVGVDEEEEEREEDEEKEDDDDDINPAFSDADERLPLGRVRMARNKPSSNVTLADENILKPDSGSPEHPARVTHCRQNPTGRTSGGAVQSRGGREASADGVKARTLARKRGNNTHTRRCRKKVNDKFSELLSILPAPEDPKVNPVKHKAQILAYSIQRIREISARNHYLELMLAMSSRSALCQWVDKVVANARSLSHALEPFMELVCTTRDWKYAELWKPSRRRLQGSQELTMSPGATFFVDGSASPMERIGKISRGSSSDSSDQNDHRDSDGTDCEKNAKDMEAASCAGRVGQWPSPVVVDTVPPDPDDVDIFPDAAPVYAASRKRRVSSEEGPGPTVGPPVLKYVASSIPSTLGANVLDRLICYRERSREYYFAPRTGVPGRVFLTQRPEWLPWLTDPVAFRRSPHAQRYDIKLTFAVPVLVDGIVRMVVEFFDTIGREYDPEVMNVAGDIASLIGRAYHARHEAAEYPKASRYRSDP